MQMIGYMTSSVKVALSGSLSNLATNLSISAPLRQLLPRALAITSVQLH
jgi:hypothetical protein